MAYQNLIALLEQSNAPEIRSMRERYSNAADILTSARDMGGYDKSDDERDQQLPKVLSNADRAILFDLIAVGVNSIREWLGTLWIHIRKKITLANRIRLCGAAVAVLSGGISATLQYAEMGPKFIAAVGAVVGMLGGLATLFADQFETAPSGIRIASLDEYGKIIEMRVDVERMRIRLGRKNLAPISDDDLRAMLTRLDDYALHVIRLQFA